MSRSIHYYKIFFYIILLVSLNLPQIVFSKIALDEEVKKLTLQLRCMTCQNQSVYDSESEFAKDITSVVKKMIEEGKGEDEIKSFLVERYGEYILFKPKFDTKNLILWLFPFVLFLVFFIFFIIRLKKNS